MENSKKIAKIFKKLRNNTTASFQAKTGLKMPRKREYKQYRYIRFRFYPTRNRKFQKNSKKIQKIQKIPLWLPFKQNRFEKAEKERK